MRVIAWSACVLVGLVACKENLQWEIAFTAEELQARIAREFPLMHQGKVARITLRNPQVSLRPDSERIGLRADLEISSLIVSDLHGAISFDAGVYYTADKGEFSLVDSRVGDLDLDGVSDQHRDLARQLADQVFGSYLDQLVVYRLDPNDFGESLTKSVLKEIAVEGGHLVLRIGLL